MAAKYIQRYSASERMTHWTVAVTFFTLALTGLGLFDKRLSFLFGLFGGGENAILLHKIAGIVFFLAVMQFLLAHWKDTSTFSADDSAWLKVMGGYLHKGAKVPPMGKYNTGQKIFGISALVTALIFGLTAIVLWTPATASQDLARISFLLHSLSFVIMVPFVVVHVYLGAIGTAGALEAMTRGEVSEAWAKKYSSKWLEELRKQGKA
jgi:formate dehydrogenase subunit gamma